MRSGNGVFLIVFSLIIGLVGVVANNPASAAVKTESTLIDILDASGNAIPNCKQKYVIYYDDQKKPAGGYHRMLAFHGGGWYGGEPWAASSPLIQYFTNRGFKIVAPTYRYLDMDRQNINGTTWYTNWANFMGASFPSLTNPNWDQRGCSAIYGSNPARGVSVADQKKDIEAAFASLLFVSIFDSTINPNEKIVLLGESAGGHLAAEFALNINADWKPSLGGVVIAGAPLDFTDIWQNARGASNVYATPSRSMTLGGEQIPIPYASTAAYAKGWFASAPMDSYYWNSGRSATRFAEMASPPASSPVNLVKASSVPIYIITGNDDPIVAPEQSLRLCKKFGSPSVPVGQGWGFLESRCGTGNSYLYVLGNGGHTPLSLATDNAGANNLRCRVTNWMLDRIGSTSPRC